MPRKVRLARATRARRWRAPTQWPCSAMAAAPLRGPPPLACASAAKVHSCSVVHLMQGPSWNARIAASRARTASTARKAPRAAIHSRCMARRRSRSAPSARSAARHRSSSAARARKGQAAVSVISRACGPAESAASSALLGATSCTAATGPACRAQSAARTRSCSAATRARRPIPPLGQACASSSAARGTSTRSCTGPTQRARRRAKTALRESSTHAVAARAVAAAPRASISLSLQPPRVCHAFRGSSPLIICMCPRRGA